MKIGDIVRLILFIFLGASIYLYMGSTLASQRSYTRNYINNSYELWNMIDEIEDSLYKSKPSQKLFLDQAKETQLIALALQYNSRDFVADLIKAYNERNLKAFAEHKEQIAQQLRPIWRTAIEEEMPTKKERKSKEGWITWIKNNITDAANRFYNYFFPATQKK